MKAKRHGALRAYLKRLQVSDLKRQMRGPHFWLQAGFVILFCLALIVPARSATFPWIIATLLGIWLVQIFGRAESKQSRRLLSVGNDIRQRLRRDDLDSALGPDVAAELDRCAQNALRVLAFFETPTDSPVQPTPEERREVKAAVFAEMDAAVLAVERSVRSGIPPTLQTVTEVFAAGDRLDQFVAAVESYESAKPHEREPRMLFETLKEVKLRTPKVDNPSPRRTGGGT